MADPWAMWKRWLCTRHLEEMKGLFTAWQAECVQDNHTSGQTSCKQSPVYLVFIGHLAVETRDIHLISKLSFHLPLADLWCAHRFMMPCTMRACLVASVCDGKTMFYFAFQKYVALLRNLLCCFHTSWGPVANHLALLPLWRNTCFLPPTTRTCTRALWLLRLTPPFCSMSDSAIVEEVHQSGLSLRHRPFVRPRFGDTLLPLLQCVYFSSYDDNKCCVFLNYLCALMRERQIHSVIVACNHICTSVHCFFYDPTNLFIQISTQLVCQLKRSSWTVLREH